MKGVVSCPQPEAAEAGRRTYINGGNAVDAAIATAFSQFAADPQMCGVGGVGVLQVYHGPTREHVCIEFLPRAPLKATADMFAVLVKRPLRFDQWELEGRVNEVGYRAATCPGTVLGLWEAHRRYGSLPWKELIQPAIGLLEDGFTVPGELARLWRRSPMQEGASSMDEILSATPAARKIYHKSNGEPFDTGDLFRNPDYAHTLRAIAEEGPDVLYKGWMATKISEEFAKNGGLLSEVDFREYRLDITSPVSVDYRGYSVAGARPPSGGVQVAEILLILEGFDLAQMEFGTAEYFHTMALAQKASFVDRRKYLGDPLFQDVPTEDIFLSRSHAAQWREKILRGDEFHVPMAEVAEPAHTTTVSAIDETGTAVALTHTLSTPASGVVVDGLGFMFNNAMHGFNPYPGHPNSIAPGKARISAMSPTIVFKDGYPSIVLGAPGATKIITGVTQAIVNVLDFGMSPVEAVSAPRIHCEDEQVDLEPRVYFAVKDELEARGHKLVKSAFSYDPFFAVVQMATMDAATGRLDGAADPRGRAGLAVVR